MKIIDILKSNVRTVSFEFFPPKDDDGFAGLFETIEALKPLDPSYVSVTYGAGGSTRRKTVDLVKRIKHEIGSEAMAHLTCVGATREEIGAVLDDLHAGGIENVLPLRGDPPKAPRPDDVPRSARRSPSATVPSLPWGSDAATAEAAGPPVPRSS